MSALEACPPGGVSAWRHVRLEACPPGGLSAGEMTANLCTLNILNKLLFPSASLAIIYNDLLDLEEDNTCCTDHIQAVNRIPEERVQSWESALTGYVCSSET